MKNITQLVRRFYWTTVAAYFLHNLIMKWKISFNKIETNSGTIHSEMNVNESVRYITSVFASYKKTLGTEKFDGKIAEVGPGDSCGVALLMRADGAETVHLLDRFHSKRDKAHQARIYEKLIQTTPALLPMSENWDISDEASLDGIERFEGENAAAENFFSKNTGYHFIVSCAVMEHLADPEKALGAMISALLPGGQMAHAVDLTDHGMFSGRFHELKFLEISDALYPYLTRSAGRPNRVMFHQYREFLQKQPVDFSLSISSLAGVGPTRSSGSFETIHPADRDKSLNYVRSVRNKFATSFANVADEDLCVSGFTLTATRRSL